MKLASLHTLNSHLLSFPPFSVLRYYEIAALDGVNHTTWTSSSVTALGSAVLNGSSVELTSTTQQAGDVFYPSSFTISSQGSNVPFTSYFSFSITCGSTCADGISFIVSLSFLEILSSTV